MGPLQLFTTPLLGSLNKNKHDVSVHGKQDMYYEVDKVHLLAMFRVCTVKAVVPWWTCRTTVTTIAVEFGIHTSLAIFPASSTPGVAALPQHQCHVAEGCCNNQSDL